MKDNFQCSKFLKNKKYFFPVLIDVSKLNIFTFPMQIIYNGPSKLVGSPMKKINISV